MNIHRTGLFFLLFASSAVFGQKTLSEPIQAAPKTITSPILTATPESNILRSSTADTSLIKVQMKKSLYESAKGGYPFYYVSKKTPYQQLAKPTLVIKQVLPVAEPHATVIRKYFGAYLTGSFEMIEVGGIAKNQNLNQHQLFPFRINAQQQVEELTDYDVNWQITANSQAMRSAATASFAQSSVLASGTWYKIGVTQTGIYKINKAFLTKAGIPTAGIDVKKIRVYGNGGKMLPEMNSSFRYDDLVENAIYVANQNDSAFSDNNYVLFYATGPDEWKRSSPGLKFRATKNLYSDTSYYFLNFDLGTGKRMVPSPAAPGPANITTTSYDYYNYHEEELVNFVKSGRNFYGEYFDIINSYNFNWTDGDFVVGDTIIAEVTMAGRARTNSNFLVSGSGLNYVVTTPSVNVDYYLGDYAAAATAVGKGLLSSSGSTVNFSIIKQTANSIGWLDKLTINARRRLKVTSKQFSFRDTRVTKPGNICDFSITTSLNPTLTVWNVSNPLNPQIQSFSLNGTTVDFISAADTLNEYCVAPSSDYYTPTYVAKVSTQNLHANTQADYVIVTHPLFKAQAQHFAKLHKDQENLTSVIATTDEIYNEFSSGRPDISAIRDFVRMLYTRGTAVNRPVKYLLLIGDGSYKNKSRSLVNNSNLIPTYQSLNSLSPTNSLATDDFYGLMDPSEGANAESSGARVDLGVGRLTCKSVSEVNGIIAKIENYYKTDPNFKASDLAPENCTNLSESNMGDWRNWLMFVADDKDNALHMTDANRLTVVMQNISPTYNIDKVFLDSYQSYSTPGGKRYPDATEDFLKRINKGALIFNYTGHGGEGGLTEERILDVPTINALSNFNKLPLFVTATCEFSRYDDPDRTSAGELCLLNSKGAAIALFTTCRVAYSGPNYTLNETLLRDLFEKRADGTWPALGDVVQETKSSIGQSIYFANFHLLGDPAMPLAYPKEKVMTSSINNISVNSLSSDTLGALIKMTFKGFVSDTLGAKLTNFNGVVYSSVFDKEKTAVCLVNDVESLTSNGVPFQFQTQKNLLYRGKSEVVNGDFSFTFMVPKDISFAPGQGRISYYATNGVLDAAGSYTNVVVGGKSAQNVTPDNAGPQINLYLNDKNFVNGGTTNEKPVLYADLVDSSGINTSGNGIGHDISVILDASGNNPVLLNDYYEANLNSYQSGRVRYPFSSLSEGEHRLSFKVWDIQNNSNMAYADFIVAQSADLALKHVLNYPNPFTTHTKFFFEHNQACTPLKVVIQIYTISGKVVKTLTRSYTCEGFRPDGIDWDGKDEYGDKLGRGVYVYKVAVSDINNKKAEKIEKLVILN